MLKVRQAIEKEIISLSPKIDTQFENTEYTPKSGVPYQQLFFMPTMPNAETIDNTFHSINGLFQITLRYPTGKGVGDTMKQAEVYQKHFYVGKIINYKGRKVSIIAPTSINTLGIDGDRYSIAISIYFKSYKE